MAARFEISNDIAGRFGLQLKAANGEFIAEDHRLRALTG
jgi:uncharacterized protein YegP (UPF0339 family)